MVDDTKANGMNDPQESQNVFSDLPSGELHGLLEAAEALLSRAKGAEVADRFRKVRDSLRSQLEQKR